MIGPGSPVSQGRPGNANLYAALLARQHSAPHRAGPVRGWFDGLGASALIHGLQIGVFAYPVHRRSAAPGSTSGAGIYLGGAEAGVGTLILLIAAGRSPTVVTTAVTLAWLRLLAVILIVILMSFDVGSRSGSTPPTSSSSCWAAWMRWPAPLICAVIASRTPSPSHRDRYPGSRNQRPTAILKLRNATASECSSPSRRPEQATMAAAADVRDMSIVPHVRMTRRGRRCR
jgi:hypothetical protein